MKAIVNTETCIGCGLCVSICDAVFELDDDGKAKTIVDRIAAEHKTLAQQAAKDCPVESITIVD
ncbi:MAG: ferredoxin [Chitinivibrionales bacterium]|nr:ferredoxin [Chitinivibrionales bacterium]